MTKEITIEQYQKANREIRLRKAKVGFTANLAAYTIVNSILIAVNLLLVPVFPWFIFPLLGWGFGVTMHYIFGLRRLDQSFRMEEAKIEQLATKIKY